jgi:hypothetical protein
MRPVFLLFALGAPVAFAQTAAPGPAAVRESAVIDWKAYKAALKKAQPRADRTRAGGLGGEVKKTQLPVLLATHEDVRAAPDFQTQGTAYVAHYKPDENIDITVLGSASHLVAGKPQRPAARAAADTFEVLEDVTDLSFTRFGANYTIRATCAKDDDPRCKQPDYLSAFKDSLVPVER